ncbi:MAG: TonB-dependent receptor [Bacteroidales bacterium]|nr:TonB-dependent receptor [Bacteroidales bacterium]
MKKILAVLFCFFLCIVSFAQNQRLNMTGGKMSYAQLFNEIESQTGMSVDYDAHGINLGTMVSVPAGTTTVGALLEDVLSPAGYTYTVSRSHIILKEKPKAQTPTLRGLVVDSYGEPVIGVGIIVKGTSHGTVSGLDGSFSLNAANADVLVCSLLGYKTKEVEVGKSSYLKIVLEEDALFISDAVVVGYGVQKKENLTGAVSVVSSKSIENRSNANLGGILQGAVPGMTVTSSTGRPGEGVSLNIRGWNSINSGSPLVLVDGVVGSLERVNPNDVESISVLKDASSSAVYGAKAAFGVVLVTTKSGGDSEGYAHVRYSSRFGYSAPTASTDWETRGYYSVYIPNKFMQAYSGKPYVLYTEDDMAQLWARVNDVEENPARPWVIIDQSQGRNTYKYYANTDWWHYFFNDIKPTQNHDISFRGGTKNIKYFLSANYDKEQGIFRLIPDIYRKYNLRARFSFDVKPWMNVSNNTAFYSSVYTYPGHSNTGTTFYNLSAGNFSYLVPVNPDGTMVRETDYGTVNMYSGILANENYTNKNRTSNLTNTTEVTIRPFKKLEIKGNYTYSYNTYAGMNRSVNVTYASKIPMQTETLTTGDNEDKLTEQVQTVDLHSANVYATYTNTFKDAHNLKLMAGGQYESYYHKKLTAIGYYLLSQELNDQNLVSGDEEGVKRTETSGGQSEYALMGFFGRINYDYKGKYLVEISGRYDGTSRFPRGQRYGLFPSFSLGWRASEEEFFSPLKNWWNDAKLRFSFGSLGNQQVGYYDYIRSVSMGTQSYLFGGGKSSTATYGNPVASNLTWETVQQKNLGVDLAFLDNKITFTGEAYIRDTKNMLTTGKALPSVYGASSPKTNNADLRTKGYELALTYRNRFRLAGKPFEYSVTGTFNDFVGYITKFDNPTKDLSTYYEGMRYGEIWGYTTDGYFASDAEAAAYPVDQSPVCSIIYSSAGEEHGLRAGDLKYVDLDGDGIIGSGANTVDNPGDRRVIGNKQPRFQYGATVAFNWAGFDFSMFVQGIGRLNWYPSLDARYFWGPYARPFSSWIQKDFLDKCWSEDNPDAYFPRPRAYVAGVGAGRELTTVNDRYLQNLGYCRLKNLTVGYTLPEKLTKKIDIESVRIYFSGENLACWAPGFHCDYMDPEQAANTGNKGHIYGWQKTYMFGIDINF